LSTFFDRLRRLEEALQVYEEKRQVLIISFPGGVCVQNEFFASEDEAIAKYPKYRLYRVVAKETAVFLVEGELHGIPERISEIDEDETAEC
jgi:hypothetical protein